ncbi:MAG TPA: hypothetical protein DIT89_04455 [Planctomycetaceae bacterium]|nr:hypothetical protein [Planctomycetaceae bacterium]
MQQAVGKHAVDQCTFATVDHQRIGRNNCEIPTAGSLQPLADFLTSPDTRYPLGLRIAQAMKKPAAFQEFAALPCCPRRVFPNLPDCPPGASPGMVTRRQLLIQAGLAAGLPVLQSPQDPLNSVPRAQDDETQRAGPAEGPWRRLLLDGAAFEQQQGLKRVFHAAQPLPENPVFTTDLPRKKLGAINGPYVYGTVIREDERFRLWYQLLLDGNHVGYAESTDGVHWTTPDLQLITDPTGQPTNLVVSAWQPEKFGQVQCHNPAVIPRPADPDPTRRYALYGFDGTSRGPRVAFSPDGLTWNYTGTVGAAGGHPLFESSDVVNFFPDPYQKRWAATWKTRNRRGRAVGVAVSPDGLTWQKVLDGPVFGADDLDPAATQIYGMPVFAWQGLYLGLPWVYAAQYYRYGQYSVEKLHDAQRESPRTIDVQLAWSWDLVSWNRPPERQPLIPRGAPGQWDSGMIVTARAPVIVGDEMWFYYGGTDRVHDEPRARAAIGLAKLRLDGFCSLQNTDDREGWCLSRREACSIPQVTINGRTKPGGWILAEIVDRRGRVVPGFSREECVPFQGDSVHHQLTWKTAAFPAAGYGDYRFRFFLNQAELYSWLPAGLDPAQPDLARIPNAGP